MAKAKATKPDSAESKIVRLELSPEHHARLRVIAAEAGLSMAAYARSVVMKAIDEASNRKVTKRTKQ
jgi:predicted HicB family RNase H-like nuclease